MFTMPLRLTLLGAALALALVQPGCRSFDETAKPLVEHKPPPDYQPPIYMTGTVAAHDVPDPSRLTAEVWRVNSTPYPDSVQLFVRIYTPQGKLVMGLAPPYYTGVGNYRDIWRSLTERIGDSGRDGGIEQFTVREFSDQDGVPYELSLVLDYSGTMGSNIEGLESAAAGFVRLKRPHDRISVVKFDRAPRVVAPATDSMDELLKSFSGAGLTGFGTYTALFAAARLGGEQVAVAPAEHPRALVLFTDGEDNASNVTPSQLYEFCRSANVPIFTVAFGDVNRASLGDISTYTGGRFYQCYTADELRAAFEDIYRSLRNYYVVTYTPPYVPGKHIAQLALSFPGRTSPAQARAVYNTLTGRIIGDTGPITFSDTVFFEYNKSEVREQALPGVLALAELMRENRRLKIEVRGHTDATGTEAYNKGLSDARAQAVRTILIAEGVEQSRVRARGFGFDRPVASNESEEGRQKNRRVEFVVIAR